MRHSLLAICILIGMNGSAWAANSGVEEALKNRPDLSSFYKALADSGVLGELQEGIPYTVFAPKNEAFDAISEEDYPCFNSSQCKAETAQILRNHIFIEKVYIGDSVKHLGALEAMSGRFISISEPMRGRYAIEGHEVLCMKRFGEVTLYTIDGVIASPHELAEVQEVPDEPGVVSTTRKTIPDPSCAPAGCPDSATTITLIISPETAAPPESGAQ